MQDNLMGRWHFFFLCVSSVSNFTSFFRTASLCIRHLPHLKVSKGESSFFLCNLTLIIVYVGGN